MPTTVSAVATPKQMPSREIRGSAAQPMPNPTAARAASVSAMKRGVKGSIRGDMGDLVGCGPFT